MVTKSITIGNYIIKLQLWDTAGQERFKCLIPSYIKQAQIAIAVYDITSKYIKFLGEKSFTGLKYWVSQIVENKGDNVKILVVGNKMDLENNRAIQKIEASELAKENNANYIEVSAKSGINVNSMFQDAALSFLEDTSTVPIDKGGSNILIIVELVNSKPETNYQDASIKPSCC